MQGTTERGGEAEKMTGLGNEETIKNKKGQKKMEEDMQE